jgi:hypothetical protein
MPCVRGRPPPAASAGPCSAAWCGARLGETALVGEDDRLNAIADLQLREYALEVCLDRRFLNDVRQRRQRRSVDGRRERLERSGHHLPVAPSISCRMPGAIDPFGLLCLAGALIVRGSCWRTQQTSP